CRRQKGAELKSREFRKFGWIQELSSEDDIEESGHEFEEDTLEIEEDIVNISDYNSDTEEETSETEILESEKLYEAQEKMLLGFGIIQKAVVLRYSGSGSGDIYSKELLEVEVPVVTNAYCVEAYGGLILDTNICAGGEKNKDACSGDSGGPLIVKSDGKWFSVGVVSWGRTCGGLDLPGVYTRVSQYLDWIRDETADAPPCVDEVIPPVKPNLNNCGIPNSDATERIAGGVEAEPFEFPWMALIVYDKRVVGAGALISPSYVLTTASLFDTWIEWYPEVLDVFLGKHTISKREQTSRRYGVETVYHHPQYGKPTPYNNDMALLKLKVSKVPSMYRPICLPRSDAKYPPGSVLTTAGWGRISTKGRGSDALLKAQMNVWSEEECEKRYPGWFTDYMICAYKYGTDTCEQ
ncbi:transmembrane protease serine 9-like, partial [Stegodyphus dumicola]|uniref:transmembrane protease serine 9-like n=1 Tax=Stegodyphus dumicola TaxID=202533 RepID=UPI0015A9F0DA